MLTQSLLSPTRPSLANARPSQMDGSPLVPKNVRLRPIPKEVPLRPMEGHQARPSQTEKSLSQANTVPYQGERSLSQAYRGTYQANAEPSEATQNPVSLSRPHLGPKKDHLRLIEEGATLFV